MTLFDLDQARRPSPSFDTYYREIERLTGALMPHTSPDAENTGPPTGAA
jgi:hypothetical protein